MKQKVSSGGSKWWIAIAVLALAPALPARADGYDIPAPPSEGSAWILDGAGLLDDADREAIAVRQREVASTTGAPIVVVTIESLAGHGAKPLELELLARAWFDRWAIGTAEHNTGILIVVSARDRKARIELGADWGDRANPRTDEIMRSIMIPAFRDGAYSRGIKEGVFALAELAEAGPQAVREPASSSGTPWWLLIAFGAPLLIAVFAIIGVARGGSSSGDGGSSSWDSGSCGSSSSSDSGGGFSGGGGSSGDW